MTGVRWVATTVVAPGTSVLLGERKREDAGMYIQIRSAAWWLGAVRSKSKNLDFIYFLT